MSFEVGKKYLITYMVPGIHKVPRQSVVKFIETQPSDRGGSVKLYFSGRPEFGSTDIEEKYVIDKQEVPITTKCYSDRKVRR